MIDIDSRLLEEIKNSSCFGIAFGDTVPECKKCDLQAQCKKKSEGLFVEPPRAKLKPKEAPAPKKEDKKAKKETKKSAKSVAPSTKKEKEKAPAKKPTAPASAASGNMPDFKAMGLEELKGLAAERKVDWKDYGNDNITRMRLIMALKKSFE